MKTLARRNKNMSDGRTNNVSKATKEQAHKAEDPPEKNETKRAVSATKTPQHGVSDSDPEQ